MAELVAAVDETAANVLLQDALATLMLPPQNGSSSLGPFFVNYGATGKLSGGTADLIPPGTIRISDLQLAFSLSLAIGIDLAKVIPEICLPQVCIDIPCVGKVCTPKICLPRPTITVPLSFSDVVKATVDLGVDVQLIGPNWHVDAILQGIPNLQLGAAAIALLAAIDAALTVALLAIPLVGLFLAIIVNIILGLIAIAGATGLLGPILTPFLAGLRIPVYDQPKHFEAIPGMGAIDPPVFIELDAVIAVVDGSGGEDELVVSIDIS